MKKIFAIIFPIICVFAFFMLGENSFAEETKNYTVIEDGGEYLLYSPDSQSMPIFKSESLGGITDFLAETADGAGLHFSSVSADADFKISKGSFNFSGGIFFRESASMIIEGATVTLSDMNISFTKGKINLKVGGLYFISGEIFSPAGEALCMEYSAGAYFNMMGGRILASTNGGAVNISRGSAKISGGEIENTLGYAITNHSTLTLFSSPVLSGVEQEIFTTAQVALGDGNNSFVGSARVKYALAFEKGTSTEIFRCSSEDDIKGIALYDLNSAKQTLSYMKDEGIAAVSLPYTVRYYDNGQLVFTDYKLKGEIADKPSDPMREGYGFVGWRDGRGGELYEFALGVKDDVNLYSVYELLPPGFNLSSLKLEYDGAIHFLRVEELVHPLLGEGLISFEWFKNGESLAKFGSEIGVKNVSDSGYYKCKVSFSVASDSTSFFTPEVEVNISKAEIMVPSVPPRFYTGDALYPDIYSTVAYTVDRYSAVDAGVYPITVRLCDSENYKFKGINESVTEVNFEILKADNYWREPLSVSDVFEGQAAFPTAIPMFGVPEFLFSSQKDGEYESTPPLGKGEYYVKAIVIGCENYTDIESDAVKFSVIEERVLGIAVITAPRKLMYKAFEKFDPSGLIVGASYNSGRHENLEASELTFSYQRADSFRFSDSGIIISYKGASVLLRVDVAKAEYDVSSIILNDGVAIYDGTHKSLTYSGDLPTGIDGITLSAVISGGGVNVGRYTVTLEFSGASENYFIPTPIRAVVEIIPREIVPIWGERVFCYDGGAKLPSAYFTDVFGRKITLDVHGAKSYAGTYIAVANNSDPNYKLTDPEADFTITKADYDMSGITWTDSTLVYDGEEKRVEIEGGLPLGVKVIGYANNKGVLAGSYFASVAFKYDERNYNPPSFDGFSWSIEKAEYDLSGFSVTDVLALYDGNLHYPDVVGSIPNGIDGSVAEYKFTQGVRGVKEGKVKVEVIFTTDSKNYNAPANIFAYVEILPVQISVDWSDFEFVYDGESHVPTAKSDACEIIVTGEAENAGTYTAYAVSSDPNYSVTNDSVAYKINKAENAWTEEVNISDIYCNGEANPVAKALGGEVKFEFFEDEECTLPTDKFEKIGIYYVVAFTDGNENYLSIKSEPKSFNVLEVLPIGLVINLKKTDYLAFEKVGADDFEAFFQNNDKSLTEIDSKAISVSYNNGDSLRFGDTDVTFTSVENFSLKLSVNVKKNSYDMSGCTWEGLVYTYDGGVKSAILTGLPKGVEIEEYIGNAYVKAGQYEVFATLVYDENNYEKPTAPSATLVINKATVAIPTLENMIYCGTAVMPYIEPSNLYAASSESDAINAGDYIIGLELLDKENYVFENGQDYAQLPFSILKRVVRVQISDITLYLFRDDVDPTFEIVNGEICDGDELIPSFKIEGDMIYAAFDSDNYDVTVIPGNIRRVNYPSPLFITVFCGCVLLLFGMIVLLVVFYKKKQRIYSFYHSSVLRSTRRGLGGERRFLLESAKLEAPKRYDLSPTLSTDGPESLGKNLDHPSVGFAIDAEYADSAISNDLAKNLIRSDGDIVSGGWRRRIVNVDMLSRSFAPGDRIDINILKERGLIPRDTAYIKILARGFIDKPLTVYANDFSLAAVKMIALSGGKAIRARTVRRARSEKQDKNNEST